MILVLLRLVEQVVQAWEHRSLKYSALSSPSPPRIVKSATSRRESSCTRSSRSQASSDEEHGRIVDALWPRSALTVAAFVLSVCPGVLVVPHCRTAASAIARYHRPWITSCPKHPRKPAPHQPAGMRFSSSWGTYQARLCALFPAVARGHPIPRQNDDDGLPSVPLLFLSTSNGRHDPRAWAGHYTGTLPRSMGTASPQLPAALLLMLTGMEVGLFSGPEPTAGRTSSSVTTTHDCDPHRGQQYRLQLDH
ncbi:hypothetical protein B0H12DRAFT_379843 [Mycena haematopus]|nr:hypothetical protein B0H12DRAFT_379843 [Mycena haematopus]